MIDETKESSEELIKLPGAVVLDDAESEEPVVALEDDEDDLGPAEDDVPAESASEDSDDEDEQEVDSPAQTPHTGFTEAQMVAMAEAQLRAAGYVVQAPQSASVEEEDEDDELDFFSDPETALAKRDKKVAKAIMDQLAPVLKPVLEKSVSDMIIRQAEETGIPVTDAMRKMVADAVAVTDAMTLQAYASDPIACLRQAGHFAKQARGQKAPQAQVAPKERKTVVVKGVPTSIGANPVNQDVGVVIPKELVKSYKAFLGEFNEKDTKTTRQQWLQDIGYRG